MMGSVTRGTRKASLSPSFKGMPPQSIVPTVTVDEGCNQRSQKPTPGTQELDKRSAACGDDDPLLFCGSCPPVLQQGTLVGSCCTGYCKGVVLQSFENTLWRVCVSHKACERVCF